MGHAACVMINCTLQLNRRIAPDGRIVYVLLLLLLLLLLMVAMPWALSLALASLLTSTDRGSVCISSTPAIDKQADSAEVMHEF